MKLKTKVIHVDEWTAMCSELDKLRVVADEATKLITENPNIYLECTGGEESVHWLMAALIDAGYIEEE